VADAAVVVLMANQLTTLGVGPYYVSRRWADAAVAWHATVVHVALGAVALGAVLLLGHRLGGWMRAPEVARFLPGLAVAGLLDRVSYMPERVMVRAMRFRAQGLCRGAGDLAYTLASVALAAAGSGALAIVVANLARSAVRLAAMGACVARASWLAPTRWSPGTARDMLRFGLPVSVGSAAGFAARRVDNAIVSALFGADVVAAYNLAYNVADVPAVQVGEQIGDVLFPSFAALERGRRRAALQRATGLLALVTFPLATGLGAIARSLVHALLPAGWSDIGPMLAVLSSLGVARPLGWTVGSYLLAQGRPRTAAALEVLKLAAVVVLLLALGRRGPLWACAAVGLGFGLHAGASVVAVELFDGVPVGALLGRCAGPLVACAPMVGAVLAARHLGGGVLAEIAAGAAAYALLAPVFARSTFLDAVSLARAFYQRPSSTERTVSSSETRGANPST
jgi:PST family polysaccharide transporter